MKTIIKIVATIVSGVLLTLYGGWIFQLLWKWFVSETFGIQTLTLVQSIGLGLFISLATWKLPTEDTEDEGFTKTFVRANIIPIIAWSLTLLFGYVLTFFM